MSIASQFREKWGAIAAAADATRNERPDTRYAAMMKATDDLGYVLAPKAMIAGYHDALKKVSDVAATMDDTRRIARETALERLRALPAGDPEKAHSAADGVLCDLLTSLGCKDVVAEWTKVERWYG